MGFFLSPPCPDWFWDPPSLSNGYWALPSRVNRLMHEADHSPPSSVKVKNTWSYAFSPPSIYSYKAWNLIT